MRKFGFSTGTVAFGDFRRALEVLAHLEVSAIELSALRLPELEPLQVALDDINFRQYSYVSFHAPSAYAQEDEPHLVRLLARVAERGWPIIVHPDSIYDHANWLPLQESLYFENMDKRKPIGRTSDDLDQLFERYPRSFLCLDLGHAHQIDRTMSEGRLIAQKHQARIRQIHVSEVNTHSQHVALTAMSQFAFAKVLDLLPETAPVIIESVVNEGDVGSELARVKEMFDAAGRVVLTARWG